ncbi:MAG: fumarylacetoacetate hydrolase family protein [Thermoplasmatota archaeon]
MPLLEVSDGSTVDLSPEKIICLIRSYASHAEEMNSVSPGRPLFFLKPPSSILPNGGSIIIPPGVHELHHEIELGIIIGKDGRYIPVEEAYGHIGHFLPVLDITARDLQAEAKKRGLPWSEAKGFDTFAPVGPKAYPADYWDRRGRRIWLDVNGERRQDSSTDLLLFTVEEMVSELSNVMTLKEGDLIMTGTPAGVGPLHDGDMIEAGIEGMESMVFRVER